MPNMTAWWLAGVVTAGARSLGTRRAAAANCSVQSECAAACSLNVCRRIGAAAAGGSPWAHTHRRTPQDTSNTRLYWNRRRKRDG